jgi:hypothetical protein
MVFLVCRQNENYPLAASMFGLLANSCLGFWQNLIAGAELIAWQVPELRQSDKR